jgi:hypothetical protein
VGKQGVLAKTEQRTAAERAARHNKAAQRALRRAIELQPLLQLLQLNVCACKPAVQQHNAARAARKIKRRTAAAAKAAERNRAGNRASNKQARAGNRKQDARPPVVFGLHLLGTARCSNRTLSVLYSRQCRH